MHDRLNRATQNSASRGSHASSALRPELAGRVLDVVGASVGLTLLALPAAVIAVAIKLTSSGPVLYRQTRVGRHDCDFSMVKFRSMRVGTHESIMCDAEERARFAASDFKLPADDPRITPIGRWIRRLSIDEFPQLFNVLRGDMSLVGIRPVERAQLELRSPADQEMYCRLRPGLTGLWQIEGRSSAMPREREELDRTYAANKSFSGDLRILLRTPMAVLRVAHAC